MPRQWKLIALYMVIVYLAFIVSIQIAKYQTEEPQNSPSPAQEAR